MAAATAIYNRVIQKTRLVRAEERRSLPVWYDTGDQPSAALHPGQSSS